MTSRAVRSLGGLVLVAVLAAGCAGGGTSSTPPLGSIGTQASNKNANAYMQSQTVKSAPPSSAGVPPMAKTAIQAKTWMTSRTPQSQVTTLGWTQLPA